jgi:hypothetical protein
VIAIVMPSVFDHCIVTFVQTKSAATSRLASGAIAESPLASAVAIAMGEAGQSEGKSAATWALLANAGGNDSTVLTDNSSRNSKDSNTG